MIPTMNPTAATPKPVAPVAAQTGVKAALPAPGTMRSSAGEVGAGNMRAETKKAVDAPAQTVAAPRLRDRETAEQSERTVPDKDRPTGPPPAFEESPLERQARVALDPRGPAEADTIARETQDASPVRQSEGENADEGIMGTSEAPDPPPTPAERAEAGIAETRSMSEARPASLDVTR